MNKKFFSIIAIIATTMFASASASASENEKCETVSFNHVGVSLDVGVPDGAALGVVVRPYWYWLKVGAAATHNILAPGVRGSLQLDPIKFPLRLTLNGDIGHSFEGNPSSLVGKNLPSVSYTYANLHGGLEIGGWDSFSFFIHAGPTWINLQTNDFDSLTKSAHISVSSPYGNAFLIPTGKVGFTWLFL